MTDHAPTAAPLYATDFARPEDWVVESNGSVAMDGDGFRWECDGATVMGTVWNRHRFEGPLEVGYEVTCLAGANNMNFILHADTPDGDLLATSDQRTGRYAEYQVFPNYIVTYLTDQENGRSRVRLRRNPGFELLSERYLDEPIEQGRPMRLTTRIEADGTLSIARDGQVLHSARDPDPLPLSGHLGFRTWNSSLHYRDFTVRSLAGGAR